MAATEEGLRFLLLGDVKDFERAQRDALAAAENSAKGIVQASKQIGGSASYIDALQKSLRSLVNDAKSGDSRFVAIGNSVNNTAKQVQNLGKQTANTTGISSAFSRVISDAPFGFIAIQNNISPLIEAYQNFSRTLPAGSNALKIFASSIFGAGGVLIAVNALTSALTIAVQKYGSVQAALNALFGVYDNLALLQKEYIKAVETGIGKTQGEITVLNAYLNVAKNEGLSREQRLKALKEVQKEYPEYLKNLTLENVNSKEVAVQIDRLTAALIRKAKVQGAQNLIAKEQEKIFEAQNVPLEEQSSLLGQVLAAASSAGGAFNSMNVRLQSGLQQSNKEIAKSAERIKFLDQLINTLLTEDALNQTIGLDDKLTKKKVKDIKTIADVLKELEAELRAIDAQFKTVNFSLDDIDEQKITALNNAFSELVKLGMKPTNAEIRNIIGQVNTLNAAISNITDRDAKGKRLFDTSQLFQFNKKDITDPNGLKSERLVLRLPIDVDRAEILKGAQNAATKLREGINFIQGEAVDASENLRKQLNATLNNAISSGIGNIASAIGEALGTGQINSIFSAFANSIASFLEEMGKVLIAEGVALEAFKASLETFQGAPAIIAGAALVIAGSAFRAFVAKGSDSFATGGTIYGPSDVTVGDNVDGYKEHILSDLQLQKIARDAGVGGSGGNTILETRIDGTQLVVLLKRAGYQISRIN